MASSDAHRRNGGGRDAADGAAPSPLARAPTAGEDQQPPKARLRGAIHHYAVFVALAVGIMLVLDAQSPRARLGCLVYTVSTTCLFGTSALYHRPNWGPHARTRMRRLDHAAIFMLIAGTNTPLALVALQPEQATRLLIMVWGGAAAGMAQCLFFSHAPKAVGTTLYIALGWAVLPFVQQYKEALAGVDVALIVAGGIIYSVGALIYFLRRPDPVPHVFGYHEVFHVCVTLAALLHFVAVYRVVNFPPATRG